MLFNSLAFAVFLPTVFAGYWLLSSDFRRQNLLLLAASYVFYGWWDVRYLALIAGCSLVNFLAGRLIYESRSKAARRALLSVACIVSLGTLGTFKYFDFFVESFSELLSAAGIRWSPYVLNLALPVGISFFTFQALSYTIDVALGKLKPEKDWVGFFAFISFFPQLVAGPIERASNLMPQFRRPRTFDLDGATHGLCLIAFGLFKKMVVADSLSQYVDMVWNGPMFYSSVTCMIGAVFFAFQIYCDFSGYSDVARGVAKLFGFELMLNFDSPYLSSSFAEFWRRWHISLSSWFKDYVYIPLGGSRVSPARLFRNIWIVFLLSGLWHGASWAFVAWGALHALYMTLGVLRRRLSAPAEPCGFARRALSVAVVNAGVVFAWIFFRAGTVENAFTYIKAMFRCRFSTSLMALCAGIGPVKFGFCLVACLLFAASAFCPPECRFKHLKARFAFVAACSAAIIFIGMPSGGEFIYFRF